MSLRINLSVPSFRNLVRIARETNNVDDYEEIIRFMDLVIESAERPNDKACKICGHSFDHYDSCTGRADHRKHESVKYDPDECYCGRPSDLSTYHSYNGSPCKSALRVDV